MFKCKFCSCNMVVESTTYISRNTDVVLVTEDGKLVCENPVFDYTNADLQGFFCKDCERPIEDKNGYRIKTVAQLVKFLKNSELNKLGCLVCGSLIEITSDVMDNEIVDCDVCSEPFEFTDGVLIKIEK